MSCIFDWLVAVIVEFSDSISGKDQELFSLQRKNYELRSQLDEIHVQSLIKHCECDDFLRSPSGLFGPFLVVHSDITRTCV